MVFIGISYHDIMQWTEGIRMAAEEVQFPVLLKFPEHFGSSHVVSGKKQCSDVRMSLFLFWLNLQCALEIFFFFSICLIHYSHFLLHCIISHSFTIFSKILSLYFNSFSLLCQLLAGEGWGGPNYPVADKRPLTTTTLCYVLYSNE